MPIRKSQELPKSGKIICFDVGTKTIGVATSDILRMIATPYGTIKRVKWTQDKEKIRQIITEQNIVCAVVGLPLSMDGSISSQTKSCISFAENVENELELPTLLWDERLSTVSAEKAMFEQRTGRQKRASKKAIKSDVDSVAASLILQGVLGSL